MGLRDQLQASNLAVIIVASDQIVMRAECLHTAVLNKGDLVRLPNGGKPMRDHHDGFPPPLGVHVIADEFFILGVERRGDLVEEQDRCIFDDRPSDVKPLSLPAGNERAELAHKGVVASRQLHDVIVQADGLTGPNDGVV